MRFLHTSDWQLGITRRFLGTDAQARFAQARLDAVRALGRIAHPEAQCLLQQALVAETDEEVRREIRESLKPQDGTNRIDS